MMKWFLLVATVAYASAGWSRYGGVHPRYRGTHCECGQANGDGGVRIMGGSSYTPHEYPFIAYVNIMKAGMSYVCGGSIITPNHVITAAHCTSGSIMPRDKNTVRLGAHDLSSPSEYEVTVDVAKITQHPLYIVNFDGSLLNDISILTLASSINFNTPNIRPVCLPLPGLDVSGQTVRILGWGAERFNGPPIEVPKKVDTTALSPNECALTGPGIASIEPTILCTSRGQGTSYMGDSGGPVVWRDSQTNRYTLVGVVSYGLEIVPDTYPAVHTLVEPYIGWITEQIAATRPSDACFNA